MLTHGDRITMIRHMVLLGAGAFGGRQRGDGFQLRLVLPGVGEGKPMLASRKSRIMRRRVATHNVRANARHTISGTCDSELGPSQ
jgi:hypothetical protein